MTTQMQDEIRRRVRKVEAGTDVGVPVEEVHAQARKFIAGVREGFEQLDRGEGVPVEKVERRLKSWAAGKSK